MIPDLEDRVAYTSFLNGLKSGCFKFSLAKQNETTLAEALRKAVDFICVAEVCAESTYGSKRAKVPANTNTGRGNRSLRLEVMDSRFTVDRRSILALKEHPILKRPEPMIAAPKPYNI